MKQLSIRGFDDELERELRRLARAEEISLNRAALRLMRKGAGLDKRRRDRNVIGESLDHLIGTWTDEEVESMSRALEAFEQVEESMWE